MLLGRELQENAPNSLTKFGLFFGGDGDIPLQWMRSSELFKFQGEGSIILKSEVTFELPVTTRASK